MRIFLVIIIVFISKSSIYAQNFVNFFGNSGILPAYNERCIAFGDYDNDNDLDLIILTPSNGSKLYKNNGNGTFTSISTNFSITPNMYTQIKWFDYNNDGLLDLYIYKDGFSGLKIYKNTGISNNPFTLAFSLNYYGKANGVADLYHNGFQDIYCPSGSSNPYPNGGNRLLENRHDSTGIHFVLDSLSMNNTAWNSMGYWNSWVFDGNKDGLMDIFVKYNSNIQASAQKDNLINRYCKIKPFLIMPTGICLCP